MSFCSWRKLVLTLSRRRYIAVTCSAFVAIALFLSRGYLRSSQKPEKLNHVMREGIFPLPQRREYGNSPKRNSVIPLRFFKKHNGISNHNYNWMTNPGLHCQDGSEVFLFVAIASAMWEFERRDLIRKTWGSVQRPHGKPVKYLFFVGNDHKHRSEILQEFDKHGDVVMEDFDETYKNLTLKTQGQLKWVTYFCPNARYVMHVDDDVFADVRGIVGHLLGQNPNRLLHCAKVFKPKVRREGKWTMSKQDYPRSQYPMSCVGWCFVMSQDVVNDLFYMSLDTFLIHLEDVTFTGILRERIGDLPLSKMPDGEMLCQHKGWPKDKPTEVKLRDAWLALQENQE